MKIGIGSDHAGFDLKEFLKQHLRKNGFDVIDYGTDIKKSVDYPDFAEKTARGIQQKEAALGILICGTGIGMSIAANKHKGVRAARCCTIYDAILAKQHNNANILTLGARLTGDELALLIATAFIETPFLKGRHLKRVGKINKTDTSR